MIAVITRFLMRLVAYSFFTRDFPLKVIGNGTENSFCSRNTRSNNSLFTINHPQRTNKDNNNALTTKIHEKL